jgi:hypothetical protein
MSFKTPTIQFLSPKSGSSKSSLGVSFHFTGEVQRTDRLVGADQAREEKELEKKKEIEVELAELGQKSRDAVEEQRKTDKARDDAAEVEKKTEQVVKEAEEKKEKQADEHAEHGIDLALDLSGVLASLLWVLDIGTWELEFPVFGKF